MAAGLEIFDFFRMDRLDPGAVYESSDLFNDWFVASAFSQELLSLDEGNVGDFAATISSTGAVHFETVEDLEVEGEDCAYDGQMNVAGDFVSGTVDCSTSGSTAFSMESDLVE